ncbi:MAG: hypothetical protein ABI644_00670 [Arenimonas sp.]
MHDSLAAAIVIFASTLPALGIGLACITRRWMPQQFLKSPNNLQMQRILGLGMMTLSIGLLAFGAAVLVLPKDDIRQITPYFVVILNIDALVMVFLLLQKSKRRL